MTSKAKPDEKRRRIHKPAEQPDEHDLTQAPKPEVERKCEGRNCEMPGAENHSRECLLDAAIDQGWAGPLEWRDRIRALDTQRAEVESTYQRQISEITQERELLVKRLAGEGLALVEVVQPVEDMSDWRNWKAGDFIQRIDYPCEWASIENIAVGDIRKVFDVSPRAEYLGVKVDNYWMDGRAFKFVSRPAT